MKRTLFIANCTTALAGSADAVAAAQTQPVVMGFTAFGNVGELSGWMQPAVNDAIARRGVGPTIRRTTTAAIIAPVMPMPQSSCLHCRPHAAGTGLTMSVTVRVTPDHE